MSKQTEALKLALEALAASDDFLFNYHDCEPNNEREVEAYSEVRANNMAAWEAVREALAEQPAQPAQQELKRIRSIISAVTGLEDDDEEYLRDAVKALDQLIEAQPAIKQDLTPEQPAQQEQGDSNCQDDDGCPTEMAVLQRFWRGEPIPTEHYPAWFRPAQQQVANELQLHIIRKWPEGFKDRLQHVWLDVVSFIPDVKLYDLQRVLAEFGFTMKVYEGDPPASKPWVGLTDAEIRDWWRIENGLEDCNMAKLVDFTLAVRAIEAKLKEKNT